MATMIITEQPHRVLVKVWRGESWYDELPQLLEPDGSGPYDVTNTTLELFVRPNGDHATRMALLTSSGSAGILKQDAVNGLVAIYLSKSDVLTLLPSSPPEGWWQAMRLTYTDTLLGLVHKYLWVGQLFVYPGSDAA